MKENIGMAAVVARMAENGRITIPSNIRAALGLERGGSVVLEIVEGELRVRSVAQAMERARAISRRIVEGRGSASVDDFITDRRREAAREA
jgi:AbrB family looped-hinge helix DNA binding protein